MKTETKYISILNYNNASINVEKIDIDSDLNAIESDLIESELEKLGYNIDEIAFMDTTEMPEVNILSEYNN